MAVVADDVMRVYFDIVVDRALQNLATIQRKFTQIQTVVDKLKSFRNMETSLRNVGLKATSTGRFMDILSGKLVSLREATERMDFFERKGTFFGKTAADIGGIADVTPKLKKGLGEAQQILDDVTNNMDKYSTGADKATKSTEGFFKRLQSLQNAILGVGFGLLFIGMAIKAFATKVMTGLVTAFTTARDEGDFLANKVMGVSAAFEFLKFAIFDAFANSDLFLPIIDGIINMTNMLSQFIAKHPQLAAFIVIFTGIAVVVGSIMMFFGQIALSVLAMISAFEMFAPVIKVVAGLLSGVTVGAIALVVLAIAALVAMWLTNFGNIQNVIKETFGILLGTVKRVLGNVIGIFSGAFKVLKGILSGDFELIWIGLVEIVASAISGILQLVTGLGTSIVNIIIFAINLIKDAIFNMVQLAISAGRALINAFNKIPGINISTKSFDKAEQMLKDWDSKLTLQPISAERVSIAQENLDILKDIVIDAITQRDERAAAGPQITNNINVEGSVTSENDLFAQFDKFFKDKSDDLLGSPNRG